MSSIILFLKGIIIGCGKVIPGVSGSLLAITLNVYEESINKMANLFKNFKENFLYLFPLGLGILLAITLSSRFLLLLISKYYVFTMSLIIGLILGIIPKLFKKVSITKKQDIIFLIFPIILLILINFKIYKIKLKINFFTIFILGIIESLTTIVPGISGTAIYIFLGCYNFMLKIFSNPLSIEMLIFISSFGLSFLFLSKIISYLFKHYQKNLYLIIFGLMLSTIFIIIKNLLNFKINFLSIILMFLGFIISVKLDK